MARRMYAPIGRLPSLHWVNDRQVALDAPLYYELEGLKFKVPRGFITDFATVPKFLWWLFGPTGLWTWAAVLHDWLIKLLWMKHPPVNGREADRLFRLALAEVDVNLVSRWLMWTGVRWGALFNGRRNKGWWRDFPLVFIWSALAFVPLAIACVGVGIALLLFSVMHWIALLLRLS